MTKNRIEVRLATLPRRGPLYFACVRVCHSVRRGVRRCGRGSCATADAGAKGFACCRAPVVPEDAFRPNLLDTLGRWLGDSKAKVDEQLKSTQEVLGGLGKGATTIVRDAADAAREAVGVANRQPTQWPGCRPRASSTDASVANSRQTGRLIARPPPLRCAVTRALRPAAASTSGLEKCPASVRRSGRAPEPGTCTMETFVSRAVCQ